MKTYYRYRVYTENCSLPEQHREQYLGSLLEDMGFDFTLVHGLGKYNGAWEPCLIFEILSEEDIKTELVGFCETIKTLNNKDKVLLTYETTNAVFV